MALMILIVLLRFPTRGASVIYYGVTQMSQARETAGSRVLVVLAIFLVKILRGTLITEMVSIIFVVRIKLPKVASIGPTQTKSALYLVRPTTHTAWVTTQRSSS